LIGSPQVGFNVKLAEQRIAEAQRVGARRSEPVREAALTPGADKIDEPQPGSRPSGDRDVLACDRLGASSGDPEKPFDVEGVERENIDSPALIQACTLAISRFPNLARLAFQLGRGLELDGQFDLARQ
jgi:hypothetical protein